MIEILNHFYYSVYCYFHLLNYLFVPNDAFLSKNGKRKEYEDESWNSLKVSADWETDISSSSSYAILVISFFVMAYIALQKLFPFFCERPHVDVVLFFLCLLLGYFVCYYASFKNDKYKTYFKKFEKQDAVTRFWWHFLSFLEICLLILGFYLVL